MLVLFRRGQQPVT